MNSWTYLLDTNIVSDMMRHPTGRCFQRLYEVGDQTVCVSIIAACELRFGVVRRGSRRLATNLDAILASLAVIPFDGDADRQYGRMRAALQAEGRTVGAMDMLIAAHALSRGLILVTHNVKEFCRIPQLKIEDWLA